MMDSQHSPCRPTSVPGAQRRRRFWRDRRGATALEFAIIAPVMLLLIFSIIEFGYALYLRSAVESATQYVARQAITGNYADDKTQETPENRQALFLGMLREQLGTILLSNTRLSIRTSVWNTLSNVGGASQGARRSFGGANQVMRYQVDCRYGYMTPVLAWLSARPNSLLHIQATAFTKNENF